MNILNWISAQLKISDFLAWVERQKGITFSHAIFKRAKVAPREDLTDRQKLLIEYAQEFYEVEQEKRIKEAPQMSEA